MNLAALLANHPELSFSRTSLDFLDLVFTFDYSSANLSLFLVACIGFPFGGSKLEAATA